MKAFLKDILPPFLYRQLKMLKKQKYGWVGDYSRWEEAKADSLGYDEKRIIEQVAHSTGKILSGEAAFERDGVIFNDPDYNWPLIASLLYVAASHKGVLELIDFGGSLGSTYNQNQRFLENLDFVDWAIVEQEHFVDMGIEKFTHDALSFHKSIDLALARKTYKTILLSSVLQYLEDPYKFLNEVFSKEFSTILVDRMPFNVKPYDRICVQKVNPSIYSASYPCHLLNMNSFVEFFIENGYIVQSKFDAIDGKSNSYHYKGFIFEKR